MKYAALAASLALLFFSCGSDGPMGPPGPRGPAGEQGPPGVAAPVPYAVQLCPAGADTKPHRLPEQALCINSRLYAVLWHEKHGAYLAEIPPGEWTSSSPKGCRVRVKFNCEVEPI